MSIEVEFVSEELIKPLSPTPDHLRHYQLCFLDQIHPTIVVPAVMFYTKNPNKTNLEICNMLKQSLRQILTHYYPLAGRVKNNYYVTCTDEGVPFVEAKANCPLAIIQRDRTPSNNLKLVPIELDNAGELIAFCQITFFTCGGLAISWGISHKICDGFSTVMVMKTWADITKGNIDIKIHPFGWATLFPPASISTYEPENLVVKEKIVTKIFLFKASAVKAVIEKYAGNGVRLSRVEALAVFIWSRFMASTQAEQAKKNHQYSVIQGVNLRSRAEPPLPMLSFGNLVWLAIAEADMEAKADECYGIVKRMKDSTRNINADFVKKLQNRDENLDLLNQIAQGLGKKDLVTFTFSSLCNFGAYEIDFGWGKPVLGEIAPLIAKNMVMFLDTKEGKGIEAWISLKVEDMAKFESDIELLAYASSLSPNDEIPLHAQSRL